MLMILRQYTKEGMCIIEYTKNGIDVTHTFEFPEQVQETSDEIRFVPPTIQEQILTENQYQTALLEMNMMGGI